MTDPTIQSPLHRRKFLTTCATGASAAVLSQAAFAKPPVDRIKLAVKYSMIRHSGSIVDKFRIVKKAGLHGTELRVSDKPRSDEFKQAIDSTGIVVHGIINSVGDNYDDAIRFCKNIKGNSVLVIAREVKGMSYQDNFAHAASFIRRSLALAEKHEVKLLVENVRASFLKKAEEMARFIDELKSPMVQAYFDTGNCITWTAQPAEHWAKVLGKRIAKVDIKDRGHATFGDSKLAKKGVVGTHGGEVNWRAVQKELTKNQFNGWATAEVKGGDAERITGIGNWMQNVLFAKDG